MQFKKTVYLAVLTQILFVQPVFAQAIEDEALDWLQAFLRVDTINPPGNESRAVEFLAEILEAEGIPYQTAESAPGRGNIWARLEGGDEPGLIMLNHTDVVPADPKYWNTDPLSGEIRDGYLYGRGALDMKGTGISQLATFIALHRAGVALNRDVLFVATADEEAGGIYGAGWLVEHHPEIFDDVGLLINEGGSGADMANQRVFQVEVTQKVPVWLRLTAVDRPGHGSLPNATSSVTRIVQALNILRENPFAPRILPAVDAMFQGLAPTVPAEQASAFADIASAVKQDQCRTARSLGRDRLPHPARPAEQGVHRRDEGNAQGHRRRDFGHHGFHTRGFLDRDRALQGHRGRYRRTPSGITCNAVGPHRFHR